VSSLVQDAVAGIGRGGEGPVDERPLTDQERQMVARLLSDPFAFPQTFKTWLVSFLESSDLTLPISSIQGLGSTLGIGGSGNTSFIQGLLPAGTIIGWSSGRTPAGCLRCDGTAYSRSAYSRLFTEIGTSWGAGDGVTTFNVPDLRRRFPLGVGSSGFPLGTTEGRAEGNRSPKHFHNVSIPNSSSGYNTLNGGTGGAGGHGHSLGGTVVNAINGADSALAIPTASGSGAFNTSGVGDHSHDVSVGGTVNVSGTVNGNTSGGNDQDQPAFVAIHFIITT